MANPNIANATSILAQKSLVKLSSTSPTALVNNAASSGTLVIILSVIITNEDTVNTTHISVNRYSQDDIGGTAYPILNQQDIAPGAPLQLLEHPIFLDEDCSLGATAEAANDMVCEVDYLVIS